VTIAQEQQHLDRSYAHLAALIHHLESRIHSTATAPSTGTGQDLLEREALLDNLTTQLRMAYAAQTRLCFGRIDAQDGATRHIGRIGLRDDNGDPILLDWRAPNAAAFYQATLQDPMGIRLRRRIVTKDSLVTHVDDEDLTDLLAVPSSAAKAMDSPREGRMADIVATIAADQDRIIRSPLDQITVVEGGPGTGKTVVALHRAAWLLYTYRDRLAKDGVLVIGPSTAFLHYIDQVLPSLGETDVVLLTPGQLYPPVSTQRLDSPTAAKIKGDVVMAKVVAQAVHQRRRIPKSAITITCEDGAVVTISSNALRAAERSVSRSATFHAGRETFLRRLVATLVTERAKERGWDAGDQDTRQQLLADIVEDVNIRRTLNLMWLPTSPEHLVGRLLSDPHTLASAAAGLLSADEQMALLREDPVAWTVDDVPLLDEAAELLGPWDPLAAQRARAERAEQQSELASARRAIDTFGSGAWTTAEQLVERGASSGPSQTVAERAINDREWIYGHVVVDEAQDLSAMAWRVIERRTKRRSATIVGDLQQAAHPSALQRWDDALHWASHRVDIQHLTISYRITQQIAKTARDLLVAAGGAEPKLHAIRDGAPTVRASVPIDDLAAFVLSQVEIDVGRTAIVVPDDWAFVAEIAAGDERFGIGADGLDRQVAILTVAETKGLEFDRVFVVDPDEISRQRPRGADIYVASTRATQQLFLIDPEAL